MMQGHYVSGLQCNVITWEQTKRNISQKRVQKAQALQHDVDQAGKTVLQTRSRAET